MVFAQVEARAPILEGKFPLFVDAITWEDGYEMPPKEKMPDDAIAVLKKWVEMGPPDPRELRTSSIRRHGVFETT